MSSSEPLDPPHNVRASILIPTYQRRDSVLRLLTAMETQTLDHQSFEVIVCIDGSTDGTREALEHLQTSFPLRAISQENLGRAAAVNSAAAAAQGEILIRLDDDMVPTPDWLEAHLAEHHSDPALALVGIAPVMLDHNVSPFAKFMGQRFNDTLVRLLEDPDALPFEQAYTGNFSVRRAHFEQAGGFDAAFVGYGLEDYELVLRLLGLGLRLRLSRTAKAWQHYEKEFGQASRESRERGVAAVTFARLHPDQAQHVTALAEPAAPSVVRRLFRVTLPLLSSVFPGLPRLCTWLIHRAERRPGPRLSFYYELGLEYFFLLGTREAGGQAPGWSPAGDAR